MFSTPKNFDLKKFFDPKKISIYKTFSVESKYISFNELEFVNEHRFSLNFTENENIEQISFSSKKNNILSHM